MGKFRIPEKTQMNKGEDQTKNKNYVQTFGKKKNATAVAVCRTGSGLIKVNGVPIDLVEPALMRQKIMEPVLILGHDRFAKFDIRMKVSGGGYTAQIFALRQALARAIILSMENIWKNTLKER